MQIPLSKEALGKLPAPDSQGLIRVQATLSIGKDGTADLMDIDGTPVGDDASSQDDADPNAPTADDSSPMPSTPSMAGAPSGLY